jgi:hypothetical protein
MKASEMNKSEERLISNTSETIADYTISCSERSLRVGMDRIAFGQTKEERGTGKLNIGRPLLILQ